MRRLATQPFPRSTVHAVQVLHRHSTGSRLTSWAGIFVIKCLPALRCSMGFSDDGNAIPGTPFQYLEKLLRVRESNCATLYNGTPKLLGGYL